METKTTQENSEACAGLAAATGYAVRVLNPREGDCVEHGDARIDVRAVADGQVWYCVEWRGATMDGQMNLDDWPRIIQHALSKGAKFHAA